MALKELSMQIFLERKMLRFEQSLRKITFKGISPSLKKVMRIFYFTQLVLKVLNLFTLSLSLIEFFT